MPTSSCTAFRPSPSHSLGVEEELLMVSPGSLRPFGGTDAVLARAELGDAVVGEVSDGVVELRTPVCAQVGDAVSALTGLRHKLSATVSLMGAGVHPLGRFGDVRLRPGPRYELIGESLGALMRQTPHCGVHVHVGMPDGETAIRACNGMRAWIPLLQALGANSPYWYGRDSGLASTRAVICNSMPRSGIPRHFEDYDDFAATVESLRALGECPDHTFLWWEVRPHPGLGTLEIRTFDAQSSPEHLAALVALAHCLAVHEATTGQTTPGPSPEVLRELSFRAIRDGLAARLLLEGSLRPVREVARHAVGLAGAYAADLGCWEELLLVHELLEAGNGAIHQRHAAREGGVDWMLRRLADETAGGQTTDGSVSAPGPSVQDHRHAAREITTR
jgi:carboxylate-amine ligase